MKRWTKWTLISVFAMMMTVLMVGSCMDFRMKPEQADAHFAAHAVTPHFQSYQHEGRRMNYVSVGDPTKPLVLFVHGSPGSWSAFIDFLTNSRLLEVAQVASVDRPGFGDSDFGKPEGSMERQASDIAPILAANQSGRPAILVGHSLGGPVIARMAMDYPDQVGGLVLVSASIDPQLEKTKWYQIPADWMVFSWMVPQVLVTTNREILPLKSELEKMIPLWKNLHMPVTVIQGGKDNLVPPGNADFAEKMLVNAPTFMVREPEMNHFVPWNRPELIEQAVLHHLKLLPAGP